MHASRRVLITILLFSGLATLADRNSQAADSSGNVIRITIDATDLPRKLLSATLEIPVIPDDDSGAVALWYPKWVPGSHGPGGPVANVAGLLIKDSDARELEWNRTVGEPHRIVVHVEPGLTKLHVEVRYITNQPTTNSMGHDSFGSALVGIVSPSSVLLYREGIDIDDTQVAATLRLPPSWQAASALTVESTKASKTPGPKELTFQPVSMRTFVDSPIMCGKYHRMYDLVEAEFKTHQPGSDSIVIPPHRLQLFSEAESVLEVPPNMLQKLRQMVTQAGLLFRSHPFDEFDILLATSDLLSRNGLEHSRSTLNVLGQRSLQSANELKGWDRVLVPHEYIHAWCGKYRRPAGMVTDDYHTDKATELLWVYEGLTQYLGELIEARCGFMTPDEFCHRLAIEVRQAIHQQGREWRSLADTGACSHLLRAGSSSWPRLRRSQDYYMEGMLFWLEADAIIRDQTHGDRSLDDFCRDFFRTTPQSPHPHAYDRKDVVDALNRVVEFDWDGLIARRIERVSDRFDPQVAARLGYTIQYSNEKPEIPEKTFRRLGGVDAIDSLGAVFVRSGRVSDLLLDSPAHQSGLGPGMKIVGVNGHAWSENRMRDAISMSASSGQIELLVVSGDSFETHTIQYDGGPRYMKLVRNDSKRDWLAEILKPLVSTNR